MEVYYCKHCWGRDRFWIEECHDERCLHVSTLNLDKCKLHDKNCYGKMTDEEYGRHCDDHKRKIFKSKLTHTS